MQHHEITENVHFVRDLKLGKCTVLKSTEDNQKQGRKELLFKTFISQMNTGWTGEFTKILQNLSSLCESRFLGTKHAGYEVPSTDINILV